MLIYFYHSLIVDLIIFQAVVLVGILSNTLLLHRARRHTPPDRYPFVSILVPGRNEERNIKRCLFSLLAQDYPSFEVLVIDDQSRDGTRAILEELAELQPRLKIMTGSPRPEGYVGKNWACVQLAQAARGELLLFTDADTVHHPQTLCALVTSLLGERADLLTGFPRQEMKTWGERLLVPFFSWASFCFVPLWPAYRLRMPVLSNAVGQIMLFRRESYQAIGGHEKVGSSIVDDLTLARRIKAAGLRWRVVHLSDLVTCRMYSGSRDAFDGFTRNYFAAFGFHLMIYLFVFSWLMVMFWEPLIVLGLLVNQMAPTAHLLELGICISLSLFLWVIPYLEMGLNPGLGFLYPLTILANGVVACWSLYLSLAGRLSWKERSLDRPKWKWF